MTFTVVNEGINLKNRIRAGYAASVWTNQWRNQNFFKRGWGGGSD